MKHVVTRTSNHLSGVAVARKEKRFSSVKRIVGGEKIRLPDIEGPRL